MKSIVACLLVLAVSVQSQWPNNFGYGLNPAGFFGGFNGLYPGYAGFPAGPFYGHPGRFVNYPTAAASLPAYDAFGNQVGGYGQVQDTPEVAQAKAAHFAAHAAARARLFTPVVAAPAAAVPVADAAVAPITPAIETAASSLVETVAATPVVETVSAPVESVAVATPIMSRKKRQIQHQLAPFGASPFAYSFTSPLAYNHYYAGGYSPFAYSNFVTPDGYNYGAPFGFHLAHPSANLMVPAAPAVVASPVAATTSTDNTAADVPSVIA